MAVSILMILIISLSLSLLFLFLLKERKTTKLNLPPGPRPLPIIGNLHQVGELLHRTAVELSKRYGPIVHLRLGLVPSIVVSSPALAKEVLKVQDLNFCDRPSLVSFNRYTYGGLDVGNSPYGDHWRNLRKLFALELLCPKKLREFQSLRQKETDRMIEHIANKADDTDMPVVVNLSELVVFLIHTFVFKVTFGYHEGSGSEGGKYGKRSRFHEVVEECNELMGIPFAEDFFPGGFGWLIDIVTGQKRRLERNAKELDDFFQKVVDEHMHAFDKQQAMAMGEEEEEEGRRRNGGEDFVDVMIRLWKEGNTHLNVEIIKGMLADMLVAGTDTTAATIIWTMTELIRHPTAMKKAQDEIRKTIGQEKGKVEPSDLPQLSYLKLVVNEGMRLHSQLLIPRQAIKDCTVGGYDIRAKTTLYVNSWALSRDAESWGDDADEFVPERFDVIGRSSAVDHKGGNYHFLPFGAGRRICPGINFGLAGVELTLANLLYAFEWELPDGMEEGDVDMGETPGSVTHKKVPLCLVARKKSSH